MILYNVMYIFYLYILLFKDGDFVEFFLDVFERFLRRFEDLEE